MTMQRRPMSYEISLEQIDQLKRAFTPMLFEMARVGIDDQDANERIARSARDWDLFNGPRLPGGGGPAVAISASLGVVRPQLAAEKLCIRERDLEHGQALLAKYLRPEEPAAEAVGSEPEEDGDRLSFDN